MLRLSRLLPTSLTLAAVAYCSGEGLETKVVEAPDLQKFFQVWDFPASSSMWTGADGDFTLHTPDGKVLWFFGDTLVGGIDAKKQQREEKGFEMPHFTLGIQSSPTSAPSFHWKTGADGKPESYFRVRGPNPLGEYWWVVEGVSVRSSGGDSSKYGLVLVAPRIVPNASAPLGFAEVGTVVIHVADASSHPDSWEYRYCNLSGVSDGALGWHSALVWPSAGSSNEPVGSMEEKVYLFGSDSRVNGNFGSMVASRWKLSELVQCHVDKAEFLMADGTWRHASTLNGSQLLPITPAGNPETSLYRTSTAGKRWIMLDIFFDDTTVHLWATEPRQDAAQGTYSQHSVMEIPAPWNDTKTYFSYAAKFHSALPADPKQHCPNDTQGLPAKEAVAFSWVSNTFDIKTLFQPNRLDTYVPRLFRLCIYGQDDVPEQE